MITKFTSILQDNHGGIWGMVFHGVSQEILEPYQLFFGPVGRIFGKITGLRINNPVGGFDFIKIRDACQVAGGAETVRVMRLRVLYIFWFR